MSCIDCIDSMEPPPDMIESMPPPPLPSFLLPKKSVGVSESSHQLCSNSHGPLMCEKWSKRDFTGREFIELTQKDDTWLYISVFTVVGIVVLCSIVAFIVMKCRKHYHSHDPKNKRPPPLDGTIRGRDNKTDTSMSGTMLYPFVPSAHYQSHGHAADNRMLWATITPHGTRHFVSETFVPQDDHYEIVDYHHRHQHHAHGTPSTSSEKQPELRKNNLKTSFENSGFVDFDYEDPTPLMESYNTDDMDSGYQEPNSIYEGSVRGQYVSSPTFIENPNLAPLNMHVPQSPQHLDSASSRSSLEIGTLTNNTSRKGTISRRISDLPIRNARV
ncbi:uncharacterized protein LOC134835012 [Culicoides brevitarsis]|uniref:uncharacterized protein LOC134835012 n=1 Tax=Culicoides brevitarsis TaxID=469753 RepID=UPI00307BDA04